MGSPHGNSFHGAYFGAETGGGPGSGGDPMEIRWRSDGDSSRWFLLKEWSIFSVLKKMSESEISDDAQATFGTLAGLELPGLNY